MTTTALNTKISEVENKLRDTSSLVTTNVSNTKIGEVENKIPHHAKYITTEEFNKLTAENFAPRLKQAILVRKTDFDNKLIIFDNLMVIVNSLTTKDYSFFLGRIYYTSNDRPQNTFAY